MLYIVPVPIGNLEDITLRAKRILSEVEIILAEDGRETHKLMQLLGIENKPKFVALTRNHELNLKGLREVLSKLTSKNQSDLSQTKVALVSDAGTPGISDPGGEVIRMAQELGVEYTVLPGATALIPAVVASGFVAKEFEFIGFLPLKKGRQKEWSRIVSSEIPVAFYESVHRLQKCFQEMQEYLQPERKVCVCKDISKMYERIWVGTVADLSTLEIVEKGEFVIVVQGKDRY